MANIDNELKIIQNAERGEEVRNAISAAITKIAEDREFAPQTLEVGDAENHRTLTGGPWNKVKVNVSGGGSGSSFDLDHFGTITQNGYYNLWNTGWAERFPGHGWNGFEVNVPLHDANLAAKEITENGIYDPLSEGFDGYSKIVVNVPNAAGSGDLLTVSFYNGEQLLQSQQVAYGGNAVYTGTTPVGETPFVGWNPDPSRVTYNMRCQAVFAGALGGTITDDWTTIARNCKAGLAQQLYPIGSTKEINYTIGGQQFKNEMVLMAYNDSNFKSANKSVAKTVWYSRYLTNVGMQGPDYNLDSVVGLDQELVSYLTPVYRFREQVKGYIDGSGNLAYTTEIVPSPAADSKIFAFSADEYLKYKTLMQGLVKQTIGSGQHQQTVSLWNHLYKDPVTGTITHYGESHLIKSTSTYMLGDRSNWSKIDGQAVRTGMPSLLVSYTYDNSANTWDAVELNRFGFCI